jgi:vacuolar-type H+-ATPase subunit E/Vma4
MDKSSLENAIRNEAERKIHAISLKETEEINKLDDTFAADLRNFKRRMESQTDARVRQESEKIKNRASLDLRKLKLKNFEAFMDRTVQEVTTRIRSHPRYKQFLLESIVAAVRHITAGVDIKLNKEDLVFTKEILDRVKDIAASNEVSIIEDHTIELGGSIVVDKVGSRIFDTTIERVYFRKSQAIRRQAMGIFSNSA